MLSLEKLRLVLDLAYVNSFIKQNKFRYKNLTTLSEILSEGDCFTTFDLSSGYYHIVNFLVVNRPLKIGLQSIFNFVLYHLVCHQHVTFLRRFYAHLPSVSGEVSVSVGFLINVKKGEFNHKNERKMVRYNHGPS